MVDLMKITGADRVKIKDTDGNIYEGNVLIIWNAEDTEEEFDSIDIEDEGFIYGFYSKDIEWIIDISSKKDT